MTFQERAKELVGKMTLAEKCAQMKYDAPAIERLGVPAYNWWNEALHGVARAGAATVFPQAIAMAATFDTQRLEQVGTAISDEARAKYNEYKTFGETEIYQGLTYWSPNINIFRDPRWGRGHETYGEDPYLTGAMGAAFVNGLQGNDPKYRKLDATLKHYAVHSGPENMRHGFDAKVGEKDLYETYLWAFKYCIDHADPSAVMGAYNRVNGEAACASETLLQKILYGEFGFKGYVVSDCGAICDINEHHKITSTRTESAALAVNNGCILNCGQAYEWLKTAVISGMITEETITAAVEKLFAVRFRLGMFDEDCVYDQIPYDVVECPEHIALSRKAAAETMVLLKNNGVLPLKKSMNLAVIGPNADVTSVLLANYNGTPSYHTTLLEGLQNASEGRVRYARGCHLFKNDVHPYEEHPLHEAILAARASDVVVLCMGLDPSMEGEESDEFNGTLSGDKDGITLPKPQLRLIEALKAVGKPTIFVNVSGSAIDLTPAQWCDGILQVFYPGAEGGNAFADVLFGEVSPSGRLPVTFYGDEGDLPDFVNYAMTNRTYKYFTGEPLYRFGYGLSYTTFAAKDVKYANGTLTATLQNTGDADSTVSALLFLKDPQEKGVNERLAGFTKLFLKRGEEKAITIEACPEIVALFATGAVLTPRLMV